VRLRRRILYRDTASLLTGSRCGRTATDPFNLRQPGWCTLRVEPCLDPIRTDGGNAPTAATFERCPQLLLTDGMRANRTGSGVTETEHVQVRATTRHGRQTRHVIPALIAIERVEQAAIEHRLKHSAQTVQVEGIGNHEVSIYAAIRGPLPRDRHRGLSHINSQNVQPQRGNVKGVLACPAPCIENRAAKCAFARQAQYRRLWLSSVPRRGALEVRRVPGLPRPALVTGWLPPAVRLVGSGSCPLGHLRLFSATAVSEPDGRTVTGRRTRHFTPSTERNQPSAPMEAPL
jgi:hypothetical protein